MLFTKWLLNPNVCVEEITRKWRERFLHKISVNTFHVSVITMTFFLSNLADLGKP